MIQELSQRVHVWVSSFFLLEASPTTKLTYTFKAVTSCPNKLSQLTEQLKSTVHSALTPILVGQSEPFYAHTEMTGIKNSRALPTSSKGEPQHSLEDTWPE